MSFFERWQGGREAKNDDVEVGGANDRFETAGSLEEQLNALEKIYGRGRPDWSGVESDKLKNAQRVWNAGKETLRQMNRPVLDHIGGDLIPSKEVLKIVLQIGGILKHLFEALKASDGI